MGAYEGVKEEGEIESISLEETEDPFMMDTLKSEVEASEEVYEVEQRKGHIPSMSLNEEFDPGEITEREKALGPGPHQSVQTDSYYELDDKKTIQKLSGLAKHNFGFHLFYDTYNYSNANGTSSFNRIFRGETASADEQADSDPAGGILVSYLRYMNQGAFKFSWGITSGLGFNGGRGYFADDNTISNDAKVLLWSLPIELLLGTSLNLSKYFNITLKGGPSIVGLIQHRKDLPDTDKRKILRQVGYGYAAALEFNLSLSRLFPGLGIDYHRNYQATQVYLSPFIKTVSYSGFREENLEISGTSFGLGLSFDVL